MMTPGLQHQVATPASQFVAGASVRQTPLPPRTPLMPPQTPHQTPVAHFGQMPRTPGPVHHQPYPTTPRPAAASQWTGPTAYASTPQLQTGMSPNVEGWPGALPVPPRTPSQPLPQSRPAPTTSQDWARMAQQWASSRNVEQPAAVSRQPGTPRAPRTPRTQTGASPYVTTPGGGGDSTPLIDER
jgi:hypothetical protein